MTQKKQESRLRTIVPLSPEIDAMLDRYVAATGTTKGRFIAGWLEDTKDAISFLTDTMVRARENPREVAKELHSYSLALAHESNELIDFISEQSKVKKSASSTKSPKNAGGARKR